MNTRHIFAATLMAACGAVVFLCLPLLVGLIMDNLNLSESEAGTVASAYFAAYLLASASSVIWVRRVSPKLSACLAYLCMSSGLGFAALSPNIASLIASLCLAGIGGGMLFSLGVAIVAASADTDRNYGWMLVAQQLLAAAFLFAVPSWVIPIWGMSGALFSLALISLIALGSVPLIPNNFKQVSATDKLSEKRHSPMAATSVGLLALVVHFAGLSALWAFIERLGVSNNLTATDIGTALSLSMFGGLAGAFLVTRLGDRMGRTKPLWGATAIFVAVCLGYGLPLNWLLFLVLTTALSFAWNFVLAYQMGIISDLDSTGSGAVLMPAAQGLGAVIGPSLGGWLLVTTGSLALLMSVALLCTGTIVVFSILASNSNLKSELND